MAVLFRGIVSDDDSDTMELVVETVTQNVAYVSAVVKTVSCGYAPAIENMLEALLALCNGSSETATLMGNTFMYLFQTHQVEAVKCVGMVTPPLARAILCTVSRVHESKALVALVILGHLCRCADVRSTVTCDENMAVLVSARGDDEASELFSAVNQLGRALSEAGADVDIVRRLTAADPDSEGKGEALD